MGRLRPVAAEIRMHIHAFASVAAPQLCFHRRCMSNGCRGTSASVSVRPFSSGASRQARVSVKTMATVRARHLHGRSRLRLSGVACIAIFCMHGTHSTCRAIAARTRYRSGNGFSCRPETVGSQSETRPASAPSSATLLSRLLHSTSRPIEPHIVPAFGWLSTPATSGSPNRSRSQAAGRIWLCKAFSLLAITLP